MINIPTDLNLKDGADGIQPYIVSPELQNAIRYAVHLKRPLLLRGEPGCGKTQFARVLAYQIYKDSDVDYKTKYFEWNIKSTTKAADGIYTFDYFQKLHDSQLKKELPKDEKYIKKGKLGEAFENSKHSNPSILLIDEIDKADIDFPNDLLLELDQKKFYISELKETIEAEESPIVIITSNDERELPNAFLRRCVFHYIPFPKDKLLIDIVEAHMKRVYQETDEPFSGEAITTIVSEFEKLHGKMKDNPNTSKNVSTSELLDWAKTIYEHQQSKNEAITNDGTSILYPEVLFKTLNDFNLHLKIQ